MNAVISGQAGLALLLQGNRIHSMQRDRPGEWIPRPPGSLRFLLQGVDDLEVFQKVDKRRAEAELLRAGDRADALHIALMLLDPSLSDGLRIDSAQELEEMLADESIGDYVRGVLWSHPLPEDGDLEGAKKLAEPVAAHAFLLVCDFERDQPSISLVWTAWQGISDEIFGTPENRDFARAMVVRRGFFPVVVKALSEQSSAEEVSLRIFGRPEAQDVPNFREILAAWLARLELAGSSGFFEWPKDRYLSVVAEPERPAIRPPKKPA